MSGLFKSTTIKGTRLTDFSGTSAEVGKAIPFGYGTFPVDGFIGWAPLPPVEHRKVKRQGKGGVKQETYTYTLSYAVFFCKGPIYGIKWIKRNGKVVYTTDPNAPIEDRQYATKWAQRVNFHWGTRDQLPDSLIESYEGVGNVSGFPDMFYITVEDEDVTDNGGAPPNYEACVIASPPEVYLTSPLYPLNDLVSLRPTYTFNGFQTYLPPIDDIQPALSVESISMEVVVRYLSYDHPAQDFVQPSFTVEAVSMQQLVRYLTYVMPPTDFIQPSLALQSINMFTAAGYITYVDPYHGEITPSFSVVNVEFT